MERMRPVVVVSTDPDTAEIEALVRSLPGRIERRVVQKRSVPDGSTYLGRGAVEALRGWLEDHAEGDPPISDGPWLVVSPHALRPSQVLGLQDALQVEVWDRIRLILELFRQQAHIKEARLQVELAELRYELPLAREAVHRLRAGERPGFLAGGEYDVRTYEVHHKRRVRRVQGQLRQLRRERRGRRKGRRRSGFRLVALVGYTNAGKSRLLNALCGAEVDVEDRFFSTLETRTRRLADRWTRFTPVPILLTDTVGFIRDLPPWLVDAFRSTLEEVTFADALLMVVDASEDPDVVVRRMETSLGILEELGATKRVMLVLNKRDKLRREQASELDSRIASEVSVRGYPYVWISASTEDGLDALLGRLAVDLWSMRRVRIVLDAARPDHLAFNSWLHDHTAIESRRAQGTRVIMTVGCDEGQLGTVLRQAHRVDAETQILGSTGKEGVPPSG